MHLTMMNFKGGQGKSSIAINLALTLEMGIVSNDPYYQGINCLPAESRIVLEPGKPLPDIPIEIPVIYDLGGYVDPRAQVALKKSKWTIIPVVNDGDVEDLKVAMATVNEVQTYTSRIIILINRYNLDITEEAFKEVYSHPIFRLKNSTAFKRVKSQGLSLRAMMQTEGFRYKRHYLEAHQQFEKLIEFLSC